MKRLGMGSLLLTVLLTLAMPHVAMADGGSDGGGQLVMDQSGKIYFADTAPKNLNLVAVTPEVMAQLYGSKPCTQTIVQYVKENERYRKILQTLVARLETGDLSRIDPMLRKWLVTGLDARTLNLTRFPLPQLRDATSVPARFQIQGAYHLSASAVFQEQLLDKMGDSQVQELFVKEALRQMNQFVGGVQATNAQLEQTVRDVFSGDPSKTKGNGFIVAVNNAAAEKAAAREEYDKLSQKWEELYQKRNHASSRAEQNQIKVELDAVDSQMSAVSRIAFAASRDEINAPVAIRQDAINASTLPGDLYRKLSEYEQELYNAYRRSNSDSEREDFKKGIERIRKSQDEIVAAAYAAGQNPNATYDSTFPSTSTKLANAGYYAPEWISLTAPNIEIPKKLGVHETATWDIRTGKLVKGLSGCKNSVGRDDLSTMETAIEAGSQIDDKVRLLSQAAAAEAQHEDQDAVSSGGTAK